MGKIFSSETLQVCPQVIVGDQPVAHQAPVGAQPALAPAPAPAAPTLQPVDLTYRPPETAVNLPHVPMYEPHEFLYADHERPDDLRGTCVLKFYHAPTLPLGTTIYFDAIDYIDYAPEGVNWVRCDNMPCARVSRTINAHKPKFDDQFTIVSPDRYCFPFSQFLKPAAVYHTPCVQTSTMCIYDAYVVLEPVVIPRQRSSPGLFGQIWRTLLLPSSQQDEPGELARAYVVYREGKEKHCLTFSDCRVVPVLDNA